MRSHEMSWFALLNRLSQMAGEKELIMPMMVKIVVFVLVVGFFPHDQNTLAHAATPKHVVWVKYRQTPVDVADPRFEYL